MTKHSLAGHLLVASPHLGDPNFHRTVVLIVEHTSQEALGLVLNRPSEYLLRDVWQKVTGQQTDCLDPIYVGGPCEGPLMAVHACNENGQVEIVPHLWFTAHRDHLNQIVEEATPPFRIFSGYSGWGAGQLDREMEAGGWLTTPVKPKYVFLADDDALWKAVASDIGDDILKADPKIRDLPNDPSLN